VRILLETGFRPAIYYIATNGRTNTRWRGEPLTKQINDKEKKNTENQNYKTEKRYQEVSGLHNVALKRVTTHNVAAVETARSRVFTRSHSVGRITTTTPSRGI
jgi:hypothetical protein